MIVDIHYIGGRVPYGYETMRVRKVVPYMVGDSVLGLYISGY